MKCYATTAVPVMLWVVPSGFFVVMRFCFSMTPYPQATDSLRLHENLLYGGPMTTESIAFERGVSPLLERILPDKVSDVLAFQPAPELETRIDQLAAKSNEGTLTTEEKAEYEGYVRANKFLAVLRREALRFAAQKG